MARTCQCPASRIRPGRAVPVSAASRYSRHALTDPMISLDATYQRLARPWSHDQLAAHFREANSRGEERSGRDQDDAVAGPIALLASAIPQCASLSVAVHVLHVVPSLPRGELAQQLLGTADKSVTAALHLCYRALELDGRAHHYSADEWLPAIFDTAAQLLEEVGLDREPPSVVRYAQEAISWLAQAIISLNQDAPDASATITDALGRLLAVHVFTDVAHNRLDRLDDQGV
jgi:hypothetical protein